MGDIDGEPREHGDRTRGLEGFRKERSLVLKPIANIQHLSFSVFFLVAVVVGNGWFHDWTIAVLWINTCLNRVLFLLEIFDTLTEL